MKLEIFLIGEPINPGAAPRRLAGAGRSPYNP